MQDIYTLSLNNTAPSSITQDPQIKSIITALDPELQAVSRASLEPLILARIDELPEQVLDLLAWQMHADFYDLAATLSMKREAVKGSILWHMHKGTQWAVIEALRQIDIKAEFVHWHDDSSPPYTFKLKAIVAGDFYRTLGKDKLIASIRRAVEESKAARSLMTELETRMEFREDLGLYVGTSQLLSGRRTLNLQPVSFPEKSTFYFGTAQALQGQEIIRPAHEQNIYSSVYAANITLTNIDLNLGVNLDLMQELLLRFEKRIFDRIDEYESKLLLTLTQNQEQTNNRLDEILDIIRWKGADEAL